jgi:hypothetical protein
MAKHRTDANCEREYDGCDTRFCDEHGSVGGDRETGYGLMAHPSVCWKCGGFNVDED